MKIGRPELLERNRELVYRVGVESPEGAIELWFSVAEEYGDLVSDRADAALLGLILPAMRRGEDLHVEGPVSERLYYNLAGPFQIVMREVIPSLSRIRILPAEIRSGLRRARGVATGFSAGVDSFSVLADHHYGDPTPGFRLTHLLYNNVGSHGPAGNPLFRLRYERLRPVTDRIGLPFVAVDSNLMSFYSEVSFKHSYSLRNASVALLLQAGIGRSFHAAGTVLKGTHTGPARDVAFSDPVTLPMVSTECLDALSVGGIYSRVEKTLQVAQIEDSYAVLDVCVRNDRLGNCSTCKKCVRTLLTLEIAGLLDRYAAVFDFDAYRKNRHWRVARILRKTRAMSVEILVLARERGYRFPLRERLIALTGLDAVRDWLVGLAARSRGGGRWLRERKARRSPLYRPGSRTSP
ncbi:MAG: hypothetical protein ACREK2_05915 [Gemmatimonadota bacterium]